eukprot:63904-Pleurochrysis_carterae.AAC.1
MLPTKRSRGAASGAGDSARHRVLLLQPPRFPRLLRRKPKRFTTPLTSSTSCWMQSNIPSDRVSHRQRSSFHRRCPAGGDEVCCACR